MPYNNAYQTYPATYGGFGDNSNPPPRSSSSQIHGASSTTLTPLETPTTDTLGFSKLQVAVEPKEPTPRAKSDPCVQICPHETLSYDRLQRILALPNFKEEQFHHKTLNALTATSNPSAHPINLTDTRICGPPSTAGCFTHLQGKLFYQYGDFRRLYLHSEWTFAYTSDYGRENNSEDTFRRFLDNTGVWLCAHRKLSDPLVVKAVYGRLMPASVNDPIDHYVVQDEMHKECERCPTGFATEYRKEKHERLCTIKTMRLVWNGLDANDTTFWLAQCGL